MKLALLVAPAGNEVVIPVTAYASFDEGLKALVEIIGESTKINTVKNVARWSLKDEQIEDVADKLFSSYYGGCGELCDLVLIEIESGQLKRFSFNLD